MWADIRTEVTLDTVINVPYRNLNSDTTLLVCRRTGWCRTINVILECRYRQCVTFLSAYLGLDVVYEVYNFLSSLGNYLVVKSFIFAVSPACWNFYFVNALGTSIDSCPVLHNNVFTLTSVSCLCSSLHQLVSLFSWDDSGQLEECGL